MNAQYLKIGLITILTLLAATSKATELVHVYTFDQGLDDFVGDTTLQSFGGSVSNGRYTFGVDQGLAITSTEFDPANYSVELVFQADSLDLAFYKKIIDTNALASDRGLYIRDSSMFYYFEGQPGATVLTAGEDIHMVMSRDTNGDTRVYVDGVFQFVVSPTDSVAVNNTLYFFQDDLVTTTEELSGSVDLIRIYDGALTPVQVATLAEGGALLTEHDLNDAGDGLVTRDVTTNLEWVDLTETTGVSVDDINADVGGWQSAGFRVANTSEVRALFHASGLKQFGAPSSENVPVLEYYLDLFGCTFSCNDAGLVRATGRYSETPTAVNGVGIMRADIDYTNSPAVADAFRLGSTTFDGAQTSWGTYIIREQSVVDNDGDGVDDQLDNCIDHSNASQIDSDADGYGDRCDPDFDNSGTVNFVDIAQWAPFFNTVGSGQFDLNGDGAINFLDFTIITQFYLQAPGPSAYHGQ